MYVYYSYTLYYWRCLQMSVRVQVIIEEGEAAMFKSQARKESKSLSAWLREAGKKMLEMNQREQPLTDHGALKIFFHECNEREQGNEPDWESHKRLILEGFQSGKRP